MTEKLNYVCTLDCLLTLVGGLPAFWSAVAGSFYANDAPMIWQIRDQEMLSNLIYYSKLATLYDVVTEMSVTIYPKLGSVVAS